MKRPHMAAICTRGLGAQSGEAVALTVGGRWLGSEPARPRFDLAKPFNQSTHLNQSYDMAGLAKFVIPASGCCMVAGSSDRVGHQGHIMTARAVRVGPTSLRRAILIQCSPSRLAARGVTTLGACLSLCGGGYSPCPIAAARRCPHNQLTPLVAPQKGTGR